MHRGLDKNTGSAHFWSQRMRQNVGFCIKNIQKKSGGRDPRTTAAEAENFVRTHPRAHLPDAGAPPLLLGWLRPCPRLVGLFCAPLIPLHGNGARSQKN